MPQIYRVVTNPAFLDIAVPPRRSPLASIVRGYADHVAAGFRGGFFDGRQGAIGRHGNWGRELLGGTGHNWPMLVVRGERAWLARENDKVGSFTLLAAGGPTLLRGGRHVADDWELFEDTQPHARRPRTALGIRRDGNLVLVAVDAATLAEVAQHLLGEGCVDALGYDGGHGTQVWLDGQIRATWEGGPAYIPWAFVVRKQPRYDATDAQQVDEREQVMDPIPVPSEHPAAPAVPAGRADHIEWDVRWGNPTFADVTGVGRFFRPHELRSPDAPVLFVHRRLLELLDSFRERVGGPVYVNSGYRTWAHNEELRRRGLPASQKSQHLYGRAADLRLVPGMSVDQMAVLAREVGFTGIGRYAWGIHVDVRSLPTGERPAEWDYR